MTGAIKSMNNCVRGYLQLSCIDVVKYTEIEDDASFEGNTEEYINKLEFKEGEELDLDEEWDKFCDHFFNDNSFYRDVDDWADLSSEFNSKEMIWLLNETNKYWINTVGDPLDTDMFADEKDVWNNIAYYWIRERSDGIKFFVLEEIEVKFNNWLEEQKEDGNYRLTCDICYRNKQIETYAACCNDKKFCRDCYRKIKRNEDGKECPFCRGKLDLSLGDAVLGHVDYQNWTIEIRKSHHVVLTPFDSWRRKMNSIQAELLYKAGRCYEHHQDCECHLEKDCEM